MPLVVNINNTLLTAFLNFGSTHNFMDVEAAAHAGVKLEARIGLHVVVTNGDRVQSHGCYRDMPLTIANELFIIDCYNLALGSHEMVLGVQWLESLWPILWDFGRRVIQFMRNGHTVRWTTTYHTPAPTTLNISTDDVMTDLLLCFDGIFMTPTGQPLVRPRSHQIRLLLSTAPITVRPYR
jgi:hypothetical protein